MNIALILSGGTGIRMGSDVPKQYVEVKGKPIICYSMERLAHHRQVDWRRRNGRSKLNSGCRKKNLR